MAQNAHRFESLFSAPPEKPQVGTDTPPRTDMGPPPERESYQDLERKYRHRTYQAQELMIEKLLRGHFIDTAALARKLQMFDLHFEHDRFLVVLAQAVGSGNAFSSYDSDLRDGGQVGLIVSSIFSELLSEQFACFPANLEDRYAFLLNFGTTDDDALLSQVAEICRTAVKFIQDNFSLELRVCVSGSCDGLQRLHEIFRDTERAADDANTIYRDGVCARTEGGASLQRPPEPTIEKQYLNALVTQDFPMALQLTLEKVRDIYQESSALGLERVKRFLGMRMQATGSVLAVPLGEIRSGDSSVGDECNRLEQCATLGEIEQTLEHIFSLLDNQFNTAPADYNVTIGKVIRFINKKYMEPDLSVEMICDCMGKSRSYLSRLFKEKTGMNLLAYLHDTRLTEAKKLLTKTDLSISEIAAKVGYYSGWTLARAFKRYESITPTAYRKAFCDTAEAKSAEPFTEPSHSH